MSDARKRAEEWLGRYGDDDPLTLYGLENSRVEAARLLRALLAEEPEAAKGSPLDWHTTEGVLTAQEVDRLLTEGMQTYDEAEAIKRTIAGDRESVQRLTALLHECNAVCLCGCPASEHESLGEDGEDCGEEGHECIRVAPAVLEIVNRYRVAESTRDLHWREVESLRERLDKEQEERGRQYGLRLQIADEFAFLRELLVAVVRTGTKDPLLDARIAEGLRSHE